MTIVTPALSLFRRGRQSTFLSELNRTLAVMATAITMADNGPATGYCHQGGHGVGVWKATMHKRTDH